jgi:CheY-like chemotaxis protein
LRPLLAASGEPLEVLIVEDDVLIAFDLQEIVSGAAGVIVGTARSGEEGVRAAERLRPDIVLMDVRLAGRIDGIDAAEAVLRLPGVALVFVTSENDERLLRRAQELGVRIVPKPVYPVLLLDAIRGACAGRTGGMRCAGRVWEIRSAPIALWRRRNVLRPMRANRIVVRYGQVVARAADAIRAVRLLKAECRGAAEELRECRLRLADARLASAARRAGSNLQRFQTSGW